jgi:hypothetical protein
MDVISQFGLLYLNLNGFELLGDCLKMSLCLNTLIFIVFIDR